MSGWRGGPTRRGAGSWARWPRAVVTPHRDRHAKKGSRVLTSVTTATSENATPVQRLSFCKPRIMVDMTDRKSDAGLTALGPPRLGQRAWLIRLRRGSRAGRYR